jgi:putative hemolysin
MSLNDALVRFCVILLMVAANALYVAAEFATVGSRKVARSGDRRSW